MSGIINIHLPIDVSAEARLLRYREQPVHFRLQNGVVVDAVLELAIVADEDEIMFTIGVHWAGGFYNVVVQSVADLETHWQQLNIVVDTLADTLLEESE